MPEYLAPGVYVEETSFRSKSIEGVSTTTTGFVGPCRYGPIDLQPDIITSLTEFERVYGDRHDLTFSGPSEQPNFLWQGVRAFFEEGGKRLYIARVFRKLGEEPDPYLRPSAKLKDDKLDQTGDDYDDGHARAWLTDDPGGGSRDSSILIRARFPGALGNWRVTFTVVLGQNMLSGDKGKLGSGALRERDTVWIGDVTSPLSSPPAGTVGTGNFYVAQYDADKEKIQRKAEQLEKDAQNHLRTHQALAASVTMFQIAIAVGAIAVLIRRPAFWLGSLVVGAIGIVFFVQSFLLGG